MSPLNGWLQLPAKVGVDLEHPARHGIVACIRREDPHHSFGQAEGNRYSRNQKDCGGKKLSHPSRSASAYAGLSTSSPSTITSRSHGRTIVLLVARAWKSGSYDPVLNSTAV